MNKKFIFNENDYLSNDGMLTSIWGPPLWHILHTISFNYPNKPTDKQKKYYYKFYNNLKNILPCKYCRDNLMENLKKNPLTFEDLENRDKLSRWVYNLHELVNTMLNKKSNLTFEDVRERYEHFRSRCLTNLNSNVETGCVIPMYGIKSKCILNIVPNDERKISLKIDPKCLKKKIN